MQFYTGIPSHFLRDYVDQYWSIESRPGEEGERSERVVPDGRAQLIVHYGAPFYTLGKEGRLEQQRRILCGPETVWSRVTAPSGSGMFGAVFKPGGLAPFTVVPMAELVSSQVDLNDIMGRETGALHEALSREAEFSGRCRIMDDFLQQRFSLHCRFSWGTAREAARRIATTSSTLDSGRLALDLGLSLRSLERLFQSYIGLSPKFYQRICRFQTALRRLSDKGASDLAALAQVSGFYDQSHMCNEIKHFTGLSPIDLRNCGSETGE